MNWNIKSNWSGLADCPPAADNPDQPDPAPAGGNLADKASEKYIAGCFIRDKYLDELQEIRRRRAAGKGKTSELDKREAEIHEKLRAEFAEQTLSDVMPKPEDVKRANEINARFDALGIPRYAVCKRGGGITFRAVKDSCIDKPNVTATSPKVLDKYLNKTWGVSIHDVENKPLSELRPDVEKARATMTKEEKTEAKADAAQTDKLDAKPKAEHEAKAEPPPAKVITETQEVKAVAIVQPIPEGGMTEGEARQGLENIEALLKKAITAKAA